MKIRIHKEGKIALVKIFAALLMINAAIFYFFSKHSLFGSYIGGVVNFVCNGT